ncbi:MAG: 4-(cytidine 5'-diphospho)-2-C-methyl-D-erythritol kinase [Lentisphaerae bacterium]|nr:4-(cytidine 5'-diphospho)-2-C-methyl-D-erythritol kinase [Lentisphaerota bacterium]
MKITVSAPAKINLFLDVLGKRPDGFHEIRSILAPVTLQDRITIEETDGAIETVADSALRFPGIPWKTNMCASRDNLATRAALLLREATGCSKGARITIEKRVPVNGGLGGGSSDAAATLRGLNTLWRTGLGLERLMELGSQLGCDIPALVHGGIVTMGGRGELITGIAAKPAQPLWFLLVNPGFGVSTADIYGRFQRREKNRSTGRSFNEIVRSFQQGKMEDVAAGAFNALEEAVFLKYPLLRMLKDSLLAAGAPAALLSGSGATLFAIGRNRGQLEHLAARVRKDLGCPLWMEPATVADNGGN